MSKYRIKMFNGVYTRKELTQMLRPIAWMISADKEFENAFREVVAEALATLDREGGECVMIENGCVKGIVVN